MLVGIHAKEETVANTAVARSSQRSDPSCTSTKRWVNYDVPITRRVPPDQHVKEVDWLLLQAESLRRIFCMGIALAGGAFNLVSTKLAFLADSTPGLLSELVRRFGIEHVVVQVCPHSKSVGIFQSFGNVDGTAWSSRTGK